VGTYICECFLSPKLPLMGGTNITKTTIIFFSIIGIPLFGSDTHTHTHTTCVFVSMHICIMYLHMFVCRIESDF
jgi:hypothetical protein